MSGYQAGSVIYGLDTVIQLQRIALNVNMFVHGNNLEQKENHKTKYRDAESRLYLSEIRIEYNQWKIKNETLKGPLPIFSANDSELIEKRVHLLNEYKDFLDLQHYAEKFDSRSNLHSSVLEEFMYYLFKDLVLGISKNALIGKSHSFKDVFFRAPSYKDMVERPHALFEIKDHDFAIGASMKATMQCKDSGLESLSTIDSRYAFGAILLNILQIIFSITEPQTL